jgi:hypothetical protein
VEVPYAVCVQDAARFEGTVLDQREEEEGEGCGFSFCTWGFETRIGMSKAAGSAEASGLCEKRQVVRLQFWMSGHLVFLNSPRLVNIAVVLRTRLGAVR